ncbi:XAC2610-related protein [Chryseobacterium kwangjuense]|uniref:XAC2610-related protein n=1 Tax=Chryseobacterium kwangjuense TaxID=267125 RepID=A0ABW9JX78_9FLAO
MNTTIIYKTLSALLLLGPLCFGQYRFKMDGESKKYNAEIIMEECETGACRNKADIIVFNKKGEKIQTFTSENLVIYFKDGLKSAKTDIIQLTSGMTQDSPVFFGDFNFDGTEDIAIRNGNGGNYGSGSYDVYVFNSTRKQFVPSAELTDLASSYQGMFEVDAKRKRLITYARSGAALHYTSEYQIIPNKGIDLVYEEISDFSDDEKTKVTVREKIKNKWVVKKSYKK